MSQTAVFVLALFLAFMACASFFVAWRLGRCGSRCAPECQDPGMADREAACRAEVERFLDVIEEARQRGDPNALRRSLEDAMYAWLAYSACAPDPRVREARRRVLAMLAAWRDSLPEEASCS